MRRILLVSAVAFLGFLISCHVVPGGGPDLTIDGSTVLLATEDLDVRFALRGSFEETYMIFGGAHNGHGNAVSNVTLSVINVQKARPIYRKYPDFYRCSSGGAVLAKNAVADMDLVPADGGSLKALKQSIEDFGDSIRNGSDRVCVALEGRILNMESVEIREIGQDVTHTFPSSRFYLVNDVERVDCRNALGGA
jgi:hypothetical protein